MAPSPSETSVATNCAALSTLEHQAPELEALLPAVVSGRALSRWSVRGRCLLELAFEPDQVDEILELAEPPGGSRVIDINHLGYAVAGRADTERDPPFFIFGGDRPLDPDEIDLALFLLFGTAGFHDVASATDLGGYQGQTIAGKVVFVGTVEMLSQNEHQRGRPYLYQTDDYMFIVVTDDDAWAEDAIRQLP